jgi:hypothetical protein
MATINLRFAFEKETKGAGAFRKLVRMASQLSRRALARSTFESMPDEKIPQTLTVTITI